MRSSRGELAWCPINPLAPLTVLLLRPPPPPSYFCGHHHHPRLPFSVWYNAKTYLSAIAKEAQQRGDPTCTQFCMTEATTLLQRGMKLLPQDCLLHFAAADFFEEQVRVRHPSAKKQEEERWCLS